MQNIQSHIQTLATYSLNATSFFVQNKNNVYVGILMYFYQRQLDCNTFGYVGHKTSVGLEKPAASQCPSQTIFNYRPRGMFRPNFNRVFHMCKIYRHITNFNNIFVKCNIIFVQSKNNVNVGILMYFYQRQLDCTTYFGIC